MKLSKFFKVFKKNKRVIICIHGFGKRRADEYLNLLAHLEDEEVILPNLFDQRFKEDTSWFNWVSKAEEVLIKAKNEKKEIILIGFSMGGVIATYLASKFEVKRLILLAPAFEYLTPTTAKMGIKKVISNKKETTDGYIELPSSYTNTFFDVVNNCKDAISHIQCPTLMIHCSDDEVISYKVSLKYFDKIEHNDKFCIILGGGQHRILDDPILKDYVIDLIVKEIKK